MPLEPKQQPARVLILDEAVAFGGSIVSTANLIRGLDPDRYVAVFGTATTRDLVREKLKEAEGTCPILVLRKTLHYARLSALRSRIGSIPFRPLRKVATYGLYVARVLANLPYMARVALAVVRYRVDLVQLNNGFRNDEGAFIGLLLRRPMVVFFRGYTPMSVLDKSIFLSRIRAFVAVARHDREKAVRGGVPADRIIVATPPAIPETLPDGARRRVRERYGIPLDVPVAGIFGRIVPWKGHLEFTRAAAIVSEALPQARFLVVGDISDGSEEYEAKMKALIRETGLESRVVFTGYVDDVDAHYSSVDVVAHASIKPEPSGRVIFEAMSNAVPVVASHLGGPKEFIDDGTDGFIVDPTDAPAFAARILELLKSPNLRREMGSKARRKVEDRYGKERYAEAVMATYDYALEATNSLEKARLEVYE